MPNYNLLQSIPVPQVVGQVPSQPNQADSLAGGLMSGLQAGQQARLQRQAADQSAQLFPLQKQLLEQNVAKGQSEAAGAEAARRDAATLRAAAQESYQAYIEAAMKIDPAQALAVVKQQADIKKTLADATSSEEEAKTKGAANYYNIATGMADLAGSSLSRATNPQTGQVDWNTANQVYQQGLKFLPEGIQKAVPPQLDQGTFANLSVLGADAHASQIEKESGKNKTSLEKDQNYRDRLQAKVDAGTATPADIRNLKEADAALSKSGDKGLIKGAISAVGDAISGGIDSISNTYKSATAPTITAEEAMAELARRQGKR